MAACMFVMMAVLGSSLMVLSAGQATCRNEPGIQWLSDPLDCTRFYVCFNGRKFQFKCSESSVWNAEFTTCVARGSQLDKCNAVPRKLENADVLADDNSIRGLCAQSGNSAIYGKVNNCAQYYDCSSEGFPVTVDSNPLLRECEFPLLFNVDTKQCEHYENVKCGDRMEPKDGCEYEANQCIRSHCISCSVRFPSCNGRADGPNVWAGREESPQYVICHQGRAISQERCDLSHGTQIFDPAKRECVERD